MNNQNIENKETAIQIEQQFKSKQEIIENIIQIFADNIKSISDAKNILNEVIEELDKQPVMIINKNIKQTYSMRNRGLIN